MKPRFESPAGPSASRAVESAVKRAAGPVVDVFIGIGSNIDAHKHLKIAVDELGHRFDSLRCSAVFRSPAFGFVGDDFLNMVAAVRTNLTADAVDQLLSEIEYAGGRRRQAQRYSPRTLDLDLLLYGGCVDAERRLPREDVLRFPFVLGPLVELAPALEHPVTGIPLDAAWRIMVAAGIKQERLGVLANLED